MYRRYAGLFFCCCVDSNDNELAYLEAIHLFVEILGMSDTPVHVSGIGKPEQILFAGWWLTCRCLLSKCLRAGPCVFILQSMSIIFFCL